MREIKPAAPLKLKDIGAEVYAGISAELFIRIFEMKHESEVCLDAAEAEALRDFLSDALAGKKRPAEHK